MVGRARPTVAAGVRCETEDNMMKFDGEARFRRDRTQRHLGALRREGFQPARRHPSASRHRYHQRAYTDDELDDEWHGDCASAASARCGACVAPALRARYLAPAHSSARQGACDARPATSVWPGYVDRTARSGWAACARSTATRGWASPKHRATAASLRPQCASGPSLPTAASSRCVLTLVLLLAPEAVHVPSGCPWHACARALSMPASAPAPGFAGEL